MTRRYLVYYKIPQLNISADDEFEIYLDRIAHNNTYTIATSSLELLRGQIATKHKTNPEHVRIVNMMPLNHIK